MKQTKMNERGRKQEERQRRIENIIVVFAVLIPLVIIIFAVYFGMKNPEVDYIIRTEDEEYQITLSPGSVSEACKQLGITDYLIISEKEEDGKITVEVGKEYHASIISQGGSRVVSFTECTVKELLEQYGYTVDDYDYIDPPADTLLKEDAEIRITDISYEYVTQTEDVAFEVITRENDELYEGVQQIFQYGEYGEKEVLYRIIKENGIEKSRQAVLENQTKAPINCIIENGTKPVENEKQAEEISAQKEQTDDEIELTPVVQTIPTYDAQGQLSTAGRALVWSVPASIYDDEVNKIITAGDGSSYAYSSVIDVTATAYHRIEDGGTITATGTVTQYGTIAVDPSVIPLGTRLYVVSDGGQSWSYGPGLAEDTGGLIKGNKIDLYFMTGDEANQFGVRSAKVYILES